MMVKEASRIMGKSDQFVRIGLQRNLLPFRTALQISNKKYSCYISPKRFMIM